MKTVPLTIFHQSADAVTADTDRRIFMQTALGGYMKTRLGVQARYTDWNAARQAAAEIKWDAIEHLDRYLAQFADNLERRGTKVFWASDAGEARDYILGVLQQHDAKRVIKSKTMTSEEIHLNHAMEDAGYTVTESDLGEFIVQLRKEAPYHFVFPAMHLRRGEISELFQENLGSEPTDDPEALTMIARERMRREYLTADVGISGANFGVAETGHISITENEGNARLTTALPRVHIALMGIEKIVPRLEDLALLLPMLGTAGAGQAMTCYNSLIGGPRQPGEADGPEVFHVVLLDNGRTRLLADPEQRDALRCIRCGACLNVCPVFKNIGGHSYGTTYQGPIGSVITPHFRGLQDWKHLSHASSLCGACTETCPVKIDLHHHLLRNRRNAVQEKPKWLERLLFKGMVTVMRRPKLFRFAGKCGAIADRLSRPIHGTRLDPVRAWRGTRTLPSPALKTFDDLWRERQRAGGKQA